MSAHRNAPRCDSGSFDAACARLAALAADWGPELGDRLERVCSGGVALVFIDFGATDRAGDRVIRLEPTQAFSELVAACAAAEGDRKITEAAFDHFETSFDACGHPVARPAPCPEKSGAGE